MMKKLAVVLLGVIALTGCSSAESEARQAERIQEVREIDAQSQDYIDHAYPVSITVKDWQGRFGDKFPYGDECYDLGFAQIPTEAVLVPAAEILYDSSRFYVLTDENDMGATKIDAERIYAYINNDPDIEAVCIGGMLSDNYEEQKAFYDNIQDSDGPTHVLEDETRIYGLPEMLNIDRNL